MKVCIFYCSGVSVFVFWCSGDRLCSGLCRVKLLVGVTTAGSTHRCYIALGQDRSVKVCIFDCSGVFVFVFWCSRDRLCSGLSRVKLLVGVTTAGSAHRCYIAGGEDRLVKVCIFDCSGVFVIVFWCSGDRLRSGLSRVKLLVGVTTAGSTRRCYIGGGEDRLVKVCIFDVFWCFSGVLVIGYALG